MKLSNGDVHGALLAMNHVCGGGNRLPTLPALRAFRIKGALAQAWEGVDEIRVQMCKDQGKMNEAGNAYVFETADAAEAFNAAWKEVCAEPRELELETLTLAEIEAGHFRHPETGKKEPGLDISPDQLGLLVRIGIVTEPPKAEPAD